MRRVTKPIALLLVAAVLFSSLSFASFARDDSLKGDLRYALCRGIEGLFRGILSGANLLVPDGENFYDRAAYRSEGFLSGTSETSAADGQARWRLGSAEASLVPDDWQEHAYYLGGYIMLENGMCNRVEELLDDMRVRVIALDDGTGSGTAVFATVDCIGMTNKDVRQIRKLLMQNMPDVPFAGITVCSTHCHSGIDTEGLWTDLLHKIPKNFARSVFRAGSPETGTDPHYMAFLYETVAGAMQSAVQRMQTGTLSYASKDIGSDYFTNKNRDSATALMTQMNRLVFTPDDASARPTMIVNVAAHPDVAGLPTNDGQSSGRGISGDYVYYMGEIVNGAGYDFMFFNGAIAGIYMSRGRTNNGQEFTRRVQQSERYGAALGRMALSLTLTERQIADDAYLSDDAVEAAERTVVESKGGQYFLWYKNWTPVQAADVPAGLRLRFAEVTVPVTNPLIRLAGKLNLAAYDVLRDGRNYYIRTEIGFMELGDTVRVALMPGEVCQDLVVGGGSLTAEGSFRSRDFGEKTICDLFGADTIVFGLANDAIGYVVPDNDYCMCGVFGHYHELISLGEKTASSILRAFADLAAES